MTSKLTLLLTFLLFHWTVLSSVQQCGKAQLGQSLNPALNFVFQAQQYVYINICVYQYINISITPLTCLSPVREKFRGYLIRKPR